MSLTQGQRTRVSNNTGFEYLGGCSMLATVVRAIFKMSIMTNDPMGAQKHDAMLALASHISVGSIVTRTITTTLIMSFSPIETSSTPTTKTQWNASKSDEARLKLQQAIQAFENFRLTNATPTSTTTFSFLSPNHHLTGVCWREFSAHVRSIPGWLAKRREATAKEKAASSERKRRGKVFWISIKYDPARATKMIAEKAVSQIHLATLSDVASQASKRPAETDGTAQPEVKKLKVGINDISNEQEGNARVTP